MHRTTKPLVALTVLLALGGCGEPAEATPTPPPASAAPSAAPAPAAPPAAARCGTPAASPAQVAAQYMDAWSAQRLDDYIACVKPEDRDFVRRAGDGVWSTRPVSFSLGDATVDGDDAEIANTMTRLDGRGGQEQSDRPVRLRRIDGVWYIR